MRALLREVAKHVDEAVAEHLAELAHHGTKTATIGTEEVLVTDDKEPLVAPRAAKMIGPGTDGLE
jgi:hypothetical protein